jgi:CubicO group peptidase (beta-lactamase class C family)
LDGQGGSSITSYLTEEVDTLGESSEPRRIKAAIASVDEPEMKTKVAKVLNRLPACGLAVGVIRNGSFEWFYGHGVSDRESNTPVTEDTVFRIGSITKTFTAIAVMQLWEQELLDLDAPANNYLRAYQLIPANPAFRPATVRHLLTHTAGIGELRDFSDLLRPKGGLAVKVGGAFESLSEYYQGGLRIEVEPGTKWAYANHGFATLGQIIEDVSGEAFDRYLREHVFGPLGMEDTDLVRSERIRPRLATGYVLRSRGLKTVTDRDIAVPGAGSIFSTNRDMARYVVALLNGGANDHGSVLKSKTLAQMFEPQYQPDPRIPGMGLAFLRGKEGDHRTIGHGGAWSGFISQLVLAPDDGIGVIAFANTRSRAPIQIGNTLLRCLLDLPEDTVRADVPEHPERWNEICGWYSPDPGPLTNARVRAVVGAGVEVGFRRGHLMLRGLTPLPPLRKGVRLYPDDENDPYVFRTDLSELGGGTQQVVFSREPATGETFLHMGMMLRLSKRPTVRNPRRWMNGALVAATVLAARRRHSERARRGSRDAGFRT